MTVAESEPNKASDTAETVRQGESRACVLHICGGIAMLAAGLALLIAT